MGLPAGATMVEKMNMCKEKKRLDEREVYKRYYKRLFSITKDTTRAKMLELVKLNEKTEAYFNRAEREKSWRLRDRKDFLKTIQSLKKKADVFKEKARVAVCHKKLTITKKRVTEIDRIMLN